MMPVYQFAHVFASVAIKLYQDGGHPYTDEPSITICSECLFQAWFGGSPQDPPDPDGTFKNFRAGSRDPRWDSFLTHEKYRQALEIMLKGIVAEHKRQMSGMAQWNP